MGGWEKARVGPSSLAKKDTYRANCLGESIEYAALIGSSASRFSIGDRHCMVVHASRA